jgi:hypothetical protein
MYSPSFAHRDTTAKNANHRPSRDWMAASRSRTRDAMNFFCWLLYGAISHPSSQSTFVVIASCDTTYQGTLLAVISRSTVLIAVIL